MDFQRIFERSPAAILCVEPIEPFRIVAATDAYLDATMTQRADIIGRGIFEIFPDNPRESDASGVRNLGASIRRVIQTRQADSMALQKYDIRVPGQDAFEERWWSPTNSPVLDDQGELRYVLHRVEDVTEFVRVKQAGERKSRTVTANLEKMETELFLRAQEVQEANRKLEVANQRLAEEAKRKGDFLALLAHELRTPFTTLFLRMQSVKRKLPPTATDFGASVEKALDQAARLKELLEGMLDFAKLEAGKTTLRKEPLELVGLVREVIDDRLLVGGTAIHLKCSERPIVGLWDPIRLEQVFGNILDNAIKFGHGHPIDVQIRSDSHDAFIAVKDQGIGIPEDQFETIFNHFERVESAQSYPGLGIGLSVAAEFARRLGGDIKVVSEPKAGSTFTIRLPLRPPSNGDDSGDKFS